MEEIDKAFNNLRNNLQKIGGKTPVKPVTKSESVTAKPSRGTPKVELIVQDCLSETEIHRMADLTSSEHDRLLVLTLFYSALRKRDCLSLTPSNLFVEQSHLELVQAKIQAAHVCGIPRWLTAELVAYIKANGIHQDKPIFDLSPYDTWDLIKKLGRQIGKKTYPNLLRHSRAIDLAENDFKETEVSRHLGHTSDKTIKTYFRFLSEGRVADRVVKFEEKPK